jgi:hypothetical protein
MAPMEYLGAWGTLIHEKNLKSKISCQTPFKGEIFCYRTVRYQLQLTTRKFKNLGQVSQQ